MPDLDLPPEVIQFGIVALGAFLLLGIVEVVAVVIGVYRLSGRTCPDPRAHLDPQGVECQHRSDPAERSHHA